jgi:catechol 2,3-dioxygenase-like lactoylglutathione lyase family enzyme
MLHHVSVGVLNVERAAKFYDAALGALGYKRIMEFLPYAIG